MKRASRTRTSSLFEKILSQYKTAWEKRDPDLAVELFTANATYQEDPFDGRPLRGRKEIYAYWEEIPRYQRNISFTYGPIFQLVGFEYLGRRMGGEVYEGQERREDEVEGRTLLQTLGGKNQRLLGVLASQRWRPFFLGRLPAYRQDREKIMRLRKYSTRDRPENPTGKGHENAL